MPTEYAIEMKGITKTFGSVVANRDVELNVRQGEILALASNPIGAKPGERVEVEATSGSSIGIALLIFAIPCVFLVLGYLLGQALGMGEMPSVGMAGLGLVVGFLPAVLVNRAITRRQQPEFLILRQF